MENSNRCKYTSHLKKGTRCTDKVKNYCIKNNRNPWIVDYFDGHYIVS